MLYLPRVIPVLLTGMMTSALAAAPTRAEAPHRAGVAAVDITPGYPVRLNGFASRKSESEGVSQKIFARAMAIDDGSSSGPAVLLAVDSLGIPDYMTTEVAARLTKKSRIDPARFAITSTHTHSAPMLRDCCPTIFGHALSADELAHIDRYTRELTDHLERVALEALRELKPARLEYGTGSVGFAINRRGAAFGPAPVDHDLPVMTVRDEDGAIRAVYFSYACHCVTLSHNELGGDWAGYAAELIAKAHPGAVVLPAIGCGADQNPSERGTVEIAQAQGKQIADEVDRLLKQGLDPITAPIQAELNRIALPFDAHPTREQWEATAKQQDFAGYHARVNLEKLDRGEKLQTELSYPVQTWTFGNQLAMVFLPGEVVVDYALRLKKEFDRSRLWVNAYSNDVPCYIPSERILKEGGYEGGGAMIFYDRPAKLAAGVEQKIIDEVHAQLPDAFAAPKGTEGVPPRSPEQSLRSIRTKNNLVVELVAAEPLVQSPIAIDWGADGRLWVCEMADYPTGAGQNWEPGGRIKCLTDSDNDGKLDKATVFLEGISFPTGLTAYGDGVLVCAAPDILFARDTDGDGKADKVETLFTGFATDNFNARVNGLSLGLDNWIYGANGLLGGVITNTQGVNVEIRNHDFRFRTLTGPFETVSGMAQQGRVRDDWGRWFGSDNTRALLYYPHEQRYLRRNPHAPSQPAIVAPPGNFDVGRLFPVSRTLERYNEPNYANRVTSACGVGVYRDTLLGDQYFGNTFTCEPVHNVVHRLVLDGDGANLTRRRAEDEQQSEFFASRDNWSRFVQARTGPDGALYVVDMYRFVIEHPRWIPAERLAQLDVRAGADKGRIYRIRSKEPLRAVRDLTTLSTADLAAALDSPNGTERDRVHLALLLRRDAAAAPILAKLAGNAKLPQVRVQALCALDGLEALRADAIVRALKDAEPRVRVHAIRLCEGRTDDPAIAEALLAAAADDSPQVRRQVALTLGEWTDPRAGAALSRLAAGAPDDAELRAAVLSSAVPHCAALLDAAASFPAAVRDAWVAPLVATAAASPDPQLIERAIIAVLPPAGMPAGPAHFSRLAGLLDVLDHSSARLDEALKTRLADVRVAAQRTAADVDAPEADRLAALSVLGRGDLPSGELELLCTLAADPAAGVRHAALSGLRLQSADEVSTKLLAAWPSISPAARPDVLALLLERDNWSTALLLAAKKRRVQPNEISLTDRNRLLESSDDALRALAAEVLGAQPSASRAEVLALYAGITALTGDAASGRTLFEKNCATCHAHNGIGHDVGAPLAGVRGREPAWLVQNIIDPNAVVDPRFVNYVVNLKDQRTLSGLIRTESAGSITMSTGGGGVTETISRSAVKDIRATSVSMMPEGFEAALPPQQMADLIAFIKSGATRREFAGNVPQTIKPDVKGTLLLPAASAEFIGETIVFEPHFRNAGYWSSRDDHLAWTIALDAPASFDVLLDYACAADSAGNTYAIEVAGKSLTGVVAETGPDWSAYRQVRIGTVALPAGEHRLVVRPDAPVRNALMDLRTLALAAPGKEPAWPVATAPAAAADPYALLRDPASIAAFILDPARPDDARQSIIRANPQFAADLIAEMTRDLPAGAKEYERIPWIWRIAIDAGRRNDTAQLRKVIEVSLPKEEEPLRDWQAVVIGGGVINGLSQRDIWPGERIAELLGNDDALKQRWQRALDLSATMADDAAVKPGTRYDALRMLAVEPWEKRGEHLARYLTHENAELQMGAVSGLADVNAPQATEALVGAIPTLTEGNRKLAIAALLRTPERSAALREAIGKKQIDPTLIDPEILKRLNAAAD